MHFTVTDCGNGSLKARTDLFADYIKKREYKKLNFVYETK